VFKTFLTAALIASGMLVFPRAQAAAPYPAMAPLAQYLSKTVADEIALARSAAPASISAQAQVLALGAHGYKVVARGGNGFVCFVMRSWGEDFDQPEFWNPRVRSPQCINTAAARFMLSDYLTRTRWVLAGASVADMLAHTKAELAAKKMTAPGPGAISYMMSKRQYVNDATRNWHPHVMFLLPPIDAATLGARYPGSPVYGSTSDLEPFTILFVVSPAWSDGTLGPAHN
jgi:hypothetical protein